MAGNPLLTNMTKNQGDPRFGAFGAGGSYQGSYSTQAEQVSADDLNQMYNAGTASPLDTNRLTVNDVVMKTGLNLGLVVLGAVVGWMVPMLGAIGAIAGFALGLVNSFKKKVSPALVMLYSVAEGLFLGFMSFMFEARYPGIVGQAVTATIIVFATILALYATGRIRTNAKLNSFFMVATISYLVFCLVNLGSVLIFNNDIRSMTVAGIPLGLIIGLFAVLLATYSLLMDFTNVSESVKAGVPERESWRLAFGLVVSLVWLYIEILRVLGYARAMLED